MTRFSFSLESVKRWRDAELGQEEGKYRMLVDAEQQAAAAIEKLGKELDTERHLLAGRNRATGHELAQVHAFAAFVARETTRLEAQREILAGQIRDQWERVQTARRAVELLDRLKTEELKKWTAEMDKELQLLADESFGIRLLGDAAKARRAKNSGG